MEAEAKAAKKIDRFQNPRLRTLQRTKMRDELTKSCLGPPLGVVTSGVGVVGDFGAGLAPSATSNTQDTSVTFRADMLNLSNSDGDSK